MQQNITVICVVEPGNVATCPGNLLQVLSWSALVVHSRRLSLSHARAGVVLVALIEGFVDGCRSWRNAMLVRLQRGQVNRVDAMRREKLVALNLQSSQARYRFDELLIAPGYELTVGGKSPGRRRRRNLMVKLSSILLAARQQIRDKVTLSRPSVRLDASDKLRQKGARRWPTTQVAKFRTFKPTETLRRCSTR